MLSVSKKLFHPALSSFAGIEKLGNGDYGHNNIHILLNHYLPPRGYTRNLNWFLNMKKPAGKTKKMFRTTFWDLFQIPPMTPELLSVRSRTSIGGITFEKNTDFDPTLSFAGVVFENYRGRDLCVEKDGDTTRILGIF